MKASTTNQINARWLGGRKMHHSSPKHVCFHQPYWSYQHSTFNDFFFTTLLHGMHDTKPGHRHDDQVRSAPNNQISSNHLLKIATSRSEALIPSLHHNYVFWLTSRSYMWWNDIFDSPNARMTSYERQTSFCISISLFQHASSRYVEKFQIGCGEIVIAPHCCTCRAGYCLTTYCDDLWSLMINNQPSECRSICIGGHIKCGWCVTQENACRSCN
jgi:hypothetical protein